MDTGLSFLEFLMTWVHFQQCKRKLYLSLRTIPKSWHISSKWRAVRGVDHMKTQKSWSSVPVNKYRTFTAIWKACSPQWAEATESQHGVPHSKQTTEPRTRVTQYLTPSNFRGAFNCQEGEVSNTLLWGGEPINCISTDSVFLSWFNFSSRLSDAMT